MVSLASNEGADCPLVNVSCINGCGQIMKSVHTVKYLQKKLVVEKRSIKLTILSSHVDEITRFD